MSYLLKLILPLHLWFWTGTMPENDNRNVVLVHNEVAEAQQHNIIVWFHGMNGFDRDEFEERTYPTIKWMVKENLSFTWIHPELPWSTRLITPQAQHAWVKQDSFVKFYNEALTKVPKLKKDKRINLIVVGHSRGGKAISEASKYGGLCKLNLAWAVWSDASYGEWLDTAMKHCLDQGVRVEIWYLKGTETQTSVKRVEKTNNKLLEIHPLTTPWYHGKIGDNVIKMTEALRNNKPSL